MVWDLQLLGTSTPQHWKWLVHLHNRLVIPHSAQVVQKSIGSLPANRLASISMELATHGFHSCQS